MITDGKLAVLDITESGNQIGEKLFVLLNKDQRQELVQYISNQENGYGSICYASLKNIVPPLTEIQKGDFYLCLEYRIVKIRGQFISLTCKEFDILALLASNPKRVFTYELITDIVWKEDPAFYSKKAIHNHVSKLRKKLRLESDLPNFIESVAGIGYKFEYL